MKHFPQRNAAILNLHARTMQINGTVDEKVEQLMKMFDEAEYRILREEISDKAKSQAEEVNLD